MKTITIALWLPDCINRDAFRKTGELKISLYAHLRHVTDVHAPSNGRIHFEYKSIKWFAPPVIRAGQHRSLFGVQCVVNCTPCDDRDSFAMVDTLPCTTWFVQRSTTADRTTHRRRQNSKYFFSAALLWIYAYCVRTLNTNSYGYGYCGAKACLGIGHFERAFKKLGSNKRLMFV